MQYLRGVGGSLVLSAVLVGEVTPLLQETSHLSTGRLPHRLNAKNNKKIVNFMSIVVKCFMQTIVHSEAIEVSFIAHDYYNILTASMRDLLRLARSFCIFTISANSLCMYRRCVK